MAELTQLRQILTFEAVAAGASAVLPHNINVKGVPKRPDSIALDNPNFDVDVAATDQLQVTVVNGGGEAATCNVYLFYDHTIERVYGPNASILQLAPAPFIIRGGSLAATEGGAQVFRYIATGAEGTDFLVTLPAARPNDSYNVQITLAGVTVLYAFDAPDLVPGDRTVTQFRIVTSAAVNAGDQFDITVTPR